MFISLGKVRLNLLLVRVRVPLKIRQGEREYFLLEGTQNRRFMLSDRQVTASILIFLKNLQSSTSSYIDILKS